MAAGATRTAPHSGHAGATPTTRRPRGSGRRLSKDAFWLLIVLVVLLVGARVALPHVILWYANKTLAEVPDYRGLISDVDVALWRGAYQIEGLDIVKTDGEVPVPFFSCPVIEFSVEWRALFDGALVGEIDFRRPTLNLVAGPTAATSQTDVDSRWQDKVKELFPLHINRFEVHDGTVHFRNFHSKPKVDVVMEDLHVLARNLSNSRGLAKTLVATIEAEGRPLGDARLEFKSEIDPYREQPTFDLNAKLEKVDVRKLNDFLQAYAGVDAEGGTLGVYAELAASDGAFTGYVKPILEDLNILDLDEEADGILQKAWEGVVDVISRIFRNLPKDRFATRVEFSGRFDKPEYDMWAVIWQAVKNAFIKVLSPELDDSVHLGDASRDQDEAGTDDEKPGDDDPKPDDESSSSRGALGADLDSKRD